MIDPAAVVLTTVVIEHIRWTIIQCPLPLVVLERHPNIVKKGHTEVSISFRTHLCVWNDVYRSCDFLLESCGW